MQRTPAMRVLVPALLVAISALSGCGKSEAPPPAQTPEVGIVTLEAQTVTLNTELPGRTNAFRIAEVRPQVNGIILKRLFKEGSDVKAGQQLYQIDPATYEADYQSAQANLASTQEQAQRYKLLVADQAVTSSSTPTPMPPTCSPRRRWSRRGSTCATPRCCRRSPAASAVPR